MTYNRIQRMPTTLDNVHESVFRSYQILEKVKEMLSRNDSVETITETIEHLESNPISAESVKTITAAA